MGKLGKFSNSRMVDFSVQIESILENNHVVKLSKFAAICAAKKISGKNLLHRSKEIINRLFELIYSNN